MKVLDAMEILVTQFSILVASGLYDEKDGITDAEMLRQCEKMLKQFAPDVYAQEVKKIKEQAKRDESAAGY